MYGEAREQAMDKFQSSKANVLVTTNLCSRGVDLNVNIVINYDTPHNKNLQFNRKVYAHRVSRTGRFGKSGLAITLNSDCNTDISKTLKAKYAINMILI